MCRGFGGLRERLCKSKPLMADRRAVSPAPHRDIVGHVHPVVDSFDSIHTFPLVIRGYTSESHNLPACTSAQYVTLGKAESQASDLSRKRMIYLGNTSPLEIGVKSAEARGCLIETTWATNAALVNRVGRSRQDFRLRYNERVGSDWFGIGLLGCRTRRVMGTKIWGI